MERKKRALAWALFTNRGKIVCNGNMPLTFKTKRCAQYHVMLMPNANWNVEIVRVQITERKP